MKTALLLTTLLMAITFSQISFARTISDRDTEGNSGDCLAGNCPGPQFQDPRTRRSRAATVQYVEAIMNSTGQAPNLDESGAIREGQTGEN